MCPWSYLARTRLMKALSRAKVSAHVKWIPFELYAHDSNHRVEREHILGREHLDQTYHHLHELGVKEKLLIFHPKYEGSSKRALIGFLYAQQKGKEKQYMDEVFEAIFEHTQDISSFAVLRRIALKLGFDSAAFLSFIQHEQHHHSIVEHTHNAKQNGVRGVPTYIINYLPVTGALEVEDYVHILRTAAGHTTPAYLITEKRPTSKAKPTPKKKSVPKKSAKKKPLKRAHKAQTKKKKKGR